VEIDETGRRSRGGHSSPLNQRLIRRHNGKRILDAVRHQGPMSRAALAHTSNLSTPTVCALVDDLLSRPGLLRRLGKGESSGGRRPLIVDFNEQYGYIAGIDIGSRSLRFALADLRGKIVNRGERRTPSGSRDAILEAIAAGVNALFKETSIDSSKLFAIGAGAPGMTDVLSGRVINAVNLKGWTDLPLRDILHRRFKVPVCVDNDVNMAALGEVWRGCAAGHPDFVFIALGAGVGAGIVLDGKLHRGSRWYAGEISHMHLDYRGWDVDYGEQGFLENRVGAEGIARGGRQAPVPGDPSVSADEAARVFEAARNGDARAARVVNEIAVYLGTAVANISTLLDPELIVFGGGIAHVGEQLFAPLREVVARIVRNTPEIRLTALGDDAQLFGSVYSALQLAEVRLFDSL
jgi:glucokinase